MTIDKLDPKGLEPCPFCGGDAELREEHDNSWIAHRGCPCELAGFTTAEEATAAWNRRASTTGVPGETPRVTEAASTDWKFCPECGSDSIHHQEGSHKQCGNCHQEWFSDVDYSETVKAHLAMNYTDSRVMIDRANERAKKAEAALSASLSSPPPRVTDDDDVRASVAECAKEYAEEGLWRSCSGCHELNDGAPSGSFSKSFGCHLGVGCGECGGIGAVWDTTDYADMAASLSSPPVSQQAEAVAVPALPRYSFVKPREFVLIASYCGDDNPSCSEQRPCSSCLAMCNVYGEDGNYRRQLGEASPAPDAVEPTSPVSAPGVVERPADCRNRLRDEGKEYPRSGCASCHTGGLTGCPHERSPETREKALEIAEQLLQQLKATPISHEHAAAQNGKMVLIAQQGVGRIIASLKADEVQK